MGSAVSKGVVSSSAVPLANCPYHHFQVLWEDPTSLSGKKGHTAWNSNIYYDFGNLSRTNQQHVTTALRIYADYLPLRFNFHPGTGTPDGSTKLTFNQTENVSDSFIGCVKPDVQDVNLANWADENTALHEIGHCLGLIHTHQRTDRDQFIEVLHTNLSVSSDNVKEDNWSVNLGVYDFCSIMHYDRCDQHNSNWFDTPVDTKTFETIGTT